MCVKQLSDLNAKLCHKCLYLCFKVKWFCSIFYKSPPFSELTPSSPTHSRMSALTLQSPAQNEPTWGGVSTIYL